MDLNEIKATIIDSLSGKSLAEISLLEMPIRADELLSSSGSLRRFTILSGTNHLWEAWYNQRTVLLRTGNVQQMANIVTYPTDGETQGHLDLIKGTRERYIEEEKSRPGIQIRRGLAMLQTLIGT
jgi:hypothetical protein